MNLRQEWVKYPQRRDTFAQRLFATGVTFASRVIFAQE